MLEKARYASTAALLVELVEICEISLVTCSQIYCVVYVCVFYSIEPSTPRMLSKLVCVFYSIEPSMPRVLSKLVIFYAIVCARVRSKSDCG